MRHGPSLAIAIAVALAGGCAAVVPGASASCKFAYTDEVRDNLVGPELRRLVGDGWKAWKIEDPTVFEGRGQVHLLIHLRDELSYMEPPEYEFVVDRCGHQMIRAGKCFQPGTGAPECGTR